MELFQLRYFVSTIRQGGLYPAAKQLHVSVPSVSRAITALEDHFKTPLFNKQGRRLIPTSEGKAFLRQAEKILSLVDESSALLKGEPNSFEVTIAGRELLLSEFAVDALGAIHQRHPNAFFRFVNCGGEDALKKVQSGDAHIAVVTQNSPNTWQKRELSQLKFVTCVGSRHELFRSRGKVSVKKLLEYPFISPTSPIFGRTARESAPDGWRDDIHPRKVKYISDSMDVYTQIIEKGLAVAYVPDYWAKRHGFQKLHITGCNFSVNLSVQLCTRFHKELTWLGCLF